MADYPYSSDRRRRGVILSFQGWQRLWAAEQYHAQQNNNGYSYTLEQLSFITGLSMNTLTKVRRRQKPVDVSTVETYFRAFNLVPNSEDYKQPEATNAGSTSLFTQEKPFTGPLPFESPFYVYRPEIEQSCFQEMMNPGMLLRIKAPPRYGKTSLITVLMEYGKSQGLQTAIANLKLIDRAFLQTTDQFLRWFCAVVARSIGLPNQLEERWDDVFGGSYSCTDYFESYLLAAGDRPLLLIIESADELFSYTDLAIDFFGMLRAWYEQGRYGAGHETWQRLRLVITHSMEVGLAFTPHQSPFNVGLSIMLPPFTVMQVQDLASRYGLEPSATYAEALKHLLGGHPYLTQMSVFHLSQSQQSLETLASETLALENFVTHATAYDSIFSVHLRRQGERLEADPELRSAIAQLLQESQGAKLPPRLAFRLHGLGWTRFQDQRSLISCELYRQYFARVLEE
ncbi:MAG: AAA-like domain-containing protein [Elainellaceae cyanobacterium]